MLDTRGSGWPSCPCIGPSRDCYTCGWRFTDEEVAWSLNVPTTSQPLHPDLWPGPEPVLSSLWLTGRSPPTPPPARLWPERRQPGVLFQNERTISQGTAIRCEIRHTTRDDVWPPDRTFKSSMA